MGDQIMENVGWLALTLIFVIAGILSFGIFANIADAKKEKKKEDDEKY